MTANAMNSATWSIALAVVLPWRFCGRCSTARTRPSSSPSLLSAPSSACSPFRKRPKKRKARSSVKARANCGRPHPASPVYRILTAKALWSIGGGGLVFRLIWSVKKSALRVAGHWRPRWHAALGPVSVPSSPEPPCGDRKRWPFHLGFLVPCAPCSTSSLASLAGRRHHHPRLVRPRLKRRELVLSTVMLQERIEDDWRGVFATDFLLMTTANAPSSSWRAFSSPTVTWAAPTGAGSPWCRWCRASCGARHPQGRAGVLPASTAQMRTPI